ncbi:MAG: TraM recognition domain-containing protein [Clostridiales bacterium]|nr:TraM recognition domain-containing protein [Clostridiales bacterium]
MQCVPSCRHRYIEAASGHNYRPGAFGNMDTRLFLGGSEKTTLKDLSESLGKETIVRP